MKRDSVISKLQTLPILIGTLFCFSLFSHDMILEFKGAYFLPINSRFKDCYTGSALYGPEFTVQLRQKSSWYMFAGIDYFKQKGRCLSLCDSTTVQLVPCAVGIKYFVPIAAWAHFYLGLGFQGEYIRKKSRRVFVTSKNTFWGYGGIGKIGFSINVPKNFLLDLFCDYSFVWTGKDNFYGHTVTLKKTNLSGVIFGAGLGYRF